MPDIVDSLKNFALPERRLFPCDFPSLTRQSAVAFESESRKLSAHEKIAAARYITKCAAAQEVDIGGSAALRIGTFSGDEKRCGIGDMFKVALGMRREVTAWHGEAMRDLAAVEKLAELVNKQTEHKPVLLEKLAVAVEDFDKKWKVDVHGVPDAVDTVFSFQNEFKLDKVGIDAGDRVISKQEFVKLDKEAAVKKLSADGAKACESFEAFASADYLTRTAIAQFIPES